jgi:hypothetical protein
MYYLLLVTVLLEFNQYLPKYKMKQLINNTLCMS